MWALIVLIAIVYVVIKIVGGGKTDAAQYNGVSSEQAAIANRLLLYAEQPEYAKEAATYRAIAMAIMAGADPIPIDSKVAPVISAQPSPQYVASPGQQVAPVPASPSQAYTPQKKVNPFELLENINVLLFIGAFLVVISVIIFVGANHDSVSDGVKMLLVLLFAASTYASGLWLYRSPKLRPAGATFAAIGMITVPLLGVAYRNYIAPDSDSAVVWFVVSVLSVLAYVGTASVIKHWAVQYAVVLAALSSVQTGLLSLDAPTYILTWAALLLAGFLLVISQDVKGMVEDAKTDPNGMISTILVPIALMASFIQTGDSGLWQLGVSMLLAGLYYLEVSLLRSDVEYSKVNFGISLFLLAVGPVLVLFDADASRQVTAGFVFGFATLFILLQTLPFNSWLEKRIDVVDKVAISLLAIAVIVWPFDESWWLALFATGALAGFSYTLSRTLSYIWYALAALLLLPVSVAFMAYDAPRDDQAFAASMAHLLIAFGLLLFRYSRVRSQITTTVEKTLEETVVIGFTMAFVGSIVAATYGSSMLLLAVLVVVGFVALFLSFAERIWSLQAIAHVAFYIALILVPDAFDIDTSPQPLFFLYGIVVFGIGALLKDSQSQGAAMWRAAGLIGIGLSVLNDDERLGIMSLFVLSAAVFIEGIFRKKLELYYVAASLAAIALHWMVYELGVEEVQVFALIWTVYFAGIAYVEHLMGRTHNAQPLTVMALLAFTGPLGLQTLSTGDLDKALMLSIEALILIFGGLYFRYKLVWQWGLVVLVAEAIYQSRGVIGAVPKQLFSLLVGLGIIGFAIYFLNKRNV